MNPLVNASHLLPQNRAQLRWLLAVDAAVIGITILLASLWMNANLQASREREQIVIGNMANTLSQSIASHLSHVDLGLKSLLLEISANPDIRSNSPKSIDQILEEQRSINPHIDSLRIADASGMVRYGNGVSRHTLVDVSEREFFLTLKSRNILDPQLTGPHMARISNKWVVTLSRRINRPDGSFAGVLYANLAADEFQHIISEVKIGAEDIVSLRMNTLKLVTRFTPMRPSVNDIGSANISSELTAAIQANQLAGSYIATTPLDQIERINAYRKLDKFPMTVVVGVSTASYMQPWRQAAIQVALLCTLIVAFTVVVSALVYLSRKQLILSAHQVKLETERTEAILKTSVDGIHLLDDNGLLLQANPAFCQLLGYREGFLVGKPMSFWSNLSIDDLRRQVQSDDALTIVKVQTGLRCHDSRSTEVEIQARHVLLGDAYAWCCSARDITQRKRQEAELYWNQTLLQSIATSSPLAFLVTDYRQDNILYTNPRFFQLWNLMHMEPLGEQGQLNLSSIIAACSTRLLNGPGFVISFLKQVEGTAQAPLEQELDMTDGRILRWVRVPMHDMQSQTFGDLFIFEDVTLRASMVRNAQRSESLLRGAIDAIEEAFVLYDPNDRLLLFNERYKALYADSVDLIVPGARFEDIVREGALRGQYAEAIGRVNEWVTERMNEHRNPGVPLIQKLKDGRLVRVLERRLPDGHTVGFRMDVTQLLQASGVNTPILARNDQTDDEQL